MQKEELIDVTELINVIKRQTDYDDKKAQDKLLEFDLNVENVVRDYMGLLNIKKETKIKSSNQERYRMIRETMDAIDKK
tara:strand:- start:219 stop:455 length:237 start_codon:yes stop_codon:yes gene_type:complete